MKQQIEEITILRGLACLAVVFVHLSAAPVVELVPGSLAMVFITFLNRALKFTTPVFIFVSGFLLMYTYQKKAFEYPVFLKRRLSVLLWPYLGWSLVYAAAFVYLGVIPKDPVEIVKKLLLADMNYHLYFVATITQFYLLFGLFRKSFERWQSGWLLAVLLAVNVFFVIYGYFPYADRFFLKYIFFFGFGCYAAVHRDWYFGFIKSHKHWFLGAYIGMVVFYGTHFYSTLVFKTNYPWYFEPLIWFFFCIVSIPMLYLASQRIVRVHKKLTAGLHEISMGSYYIYLAHPFVLYGSTFIQNRIGIKSVLSQFLINLIVVYGITVSGAIVYTKIKTLWKEKTP